ncbi:MAG: 5'/3'-nucleotidase SurE [Halobacteriaceae archaeon]
MSATPRVVLTNDDGIDSPGLRALRDALSDVGEVTVVAPAGDQSAVGRAMSSQVEVEERDLGYAIAGTPSDCVVAAVEALDLDPDVVVSGCNEGANLGMYVLGRSGTVSAAVEAAYFGVPSLAVSLYVPPAEFGDGLDPAAFAPAVDAARYLVADASVAGVFEEADYLNVNAPLGASDPEMEVTTPSHAYEMTAEREADTITLRDRIWDRMDPESCPDPPGTDRRAVVEGRVSVSPLTAPHTTHHHDALDDLAAAYR